MERTDKNKRKRERIASQVEAFLARGGEIQQIPEGRRTTNEAALFESKMEGKPLSQCEAHPKRYKQRNGFKRR